MSPVETTVAVLAGVGVLALLMKWFGGDQKVEAPRRDTDAVDALLAEVSGADPETVGEVVAVTSDGWSFVPEGHEVTLFPPASPELDAMSLAGHGRAESHAVPPSTFDIGDLVAARVKRGAPDHDPWRLEALGRDHDYRAWFFETEEAARAALDLLQRRIVRPPLDEDGAPRTVSDAEFDEARRIDEETERALDSGEE